MDTEKVQISSYRSPTTSVCSSSLETESVPAIAGNIETGRLYSGYHTGPNTLVGNLDNLPSDQCSNQVMVDDIYLEKIKNFPENVQIRHTICLSILEIKSDLWKIHIPPCRASFTCELTKSMELPKTPITSNRIISPITKPTVDDLPALFTAISFIFVDVQTFCMKDGFPFIGYSLGQKVDVIAEESSLWLVRTTIESGLSHGWVCSGHFYADKSGVQ
jgi:hypothetical protein